MSGMTTCRPFSDKRFDLLTSTGELRVHRAAFAPRLQVEHIKFRREQSACRCPHSSR